MLSIISLICIVVGYILFFFTENMIAFPIFLMIVATILAIIDLVSLYKKERLDFNDFIKEAFMTNWGSMITVLGSIFFILICIIYS